jgi:hypothetical protein
MADIRSFFSGLYQKMVNGDDYYFVDQYQDDRFGLTGDNLQVAQNHPILTPALLFTSKIFSQARFHIENEVTGNIVKNHRYLDLLNDPNFYQTRIDFLETLYFMTIAQGYSVMYKKKLPGVVWIDSLYILNPSLIEWPLEYKSSLGSRKSIEKSNIVVKYDRNGENLDIKLKDLLFVYDSPNALNKNNIFKVKSRIEGLKQTLENTTDGLIAKNIVIRTNGKELISAKSSAGAVPLNPDEKERIENIYQSNYGLSKNKKRAIITRSDVTHKSLHIALRDLGLDESTKVDGNLIYTALHIPKDILSLEAKKTTYNNFKESMVSFIQNEMQGTGDYLAGVLTRDLKKKDKNLKIVCSYEHLPVMQYILLERYKVAQTRVQALKQAREAGLPDEKALELVGMDKNIKLKELVKTQQQNEQGNSNSGNSEEEKTRDELIGL